MKTLQAKKELLNQSFIILTFLLSTFPLLTFGLRSILLIFWVLAGTLCFYFVERVYPRFEKNLSKKNYLIISILPFMVLVISMIYTENLDVGLKRLIQMLPLFIFPIIFYLNSDKFDKNLIRKIIWIFSISVILLVLCQITLSVINLDYLLADLTKQEIIRNNLSNYETISKEVVNKIKIRRFRNFVLDVSNTHFTYQGLWIVFSILFVSRELLRLIKQGKKLAYLLIPCVFFMLIWILMMSTKMPLIAMIIAFFSVLFILSRLTLMKKIVLIFITLILLFSSYLIITPLRIRFDEVVETKFEFPTDGNDIENYNSINVRNGIYFCAANLIEKNSIFGVGVGDSQEELNNCYKEEIGAKIYTWTDYNTHNQFLFFFLSTGLIGLLFFMLSIYINLKKAIITKNQIYLYFIIIICLISLTENIFSRSDGVMFFAFFANLFLFNLNNVE